MSKLRSAGIGGLAGLAVFGIAVVASNLIYAPGRAPQLLPAASVAPVMPSKDATHRGVYYPGTEPLAPDEMRVVACGTGQPSPRPKQAAACFLVELGNGDKFVFDIGAGSAERIAAQMIPFDSLDKIFLGHLHVDHFGDLASFWIGGATMNRLVPVQVWGPSGAEPKYGTKYALEKLKEAYTWDLATRSGALDARGLELQVNEFDYKGVNAVIYEKNGVVIRSLPAIHGIDGAVSFILEWNGLKFAYSSDTFPNKWWLEYTKGADIAIHECFLLPSLLVTKQGFSPMEALVVGSLGHTSPEQFGKVMSETKPRLAVGYHFFNDFDTAPAMMAAVRKTYDGPVALAQDYMVFNVTKKDILVRMSAIDEAVWPQPAQRPKEPAQGKMLGFSEFISSGRENYLPTLRNVWGEVNQQFGTDYKPLEVAKKLMGTAAAEKGDGK